MLPLERAGLDPTLVIVHPVQIWTEYGSLLTLAPPFSDGNLLLAYTRGPEVDRDLAAFFPGYTVLHYYPDDPAHFYVTPR
jgi:hypothetical protein